MLRFIFQCENGLFSNFVTSNRKPVVALIDKALMSPAFSIDVIEARASCHTKEDDLQDRIVGILDIATIDCEFQRALKHIEAGIDRLSPIVDKTGKYHQDFTSLNHVAFASCQIDSKAPELVTALVIRE